MNRARSAATKSERSAGGFLRPAVVTAREDGSKNVEIRLLAGDDRAPSALARLAVAAPYQPSPGDRVLVAGEGEELYILGVLHASAPPSLPIPGGGSVTVADGGVELSDPEGRLLVRYKNGSIEIAAPAGDLVLSAPQGRVVVRSAEDIELNAERDLSQRAGRSVAIGAGASGSNPQVRLEPGKTAVETPRLDVSAHEASVVAGEATVAARRVETTAGLVKQTAARVEITAQRLVERTEDALREASDLSETRARRARTVIQETYSLHAERTKVSSIEETSLAGRKILLG